MNPQTSVGRARVRISIGHGAPTWRRAPRWLLAAALRGAQRKRAAGSRMREGKGKDFLVASLGGGGGGTGCPLSCCQRVFAGWGLWGRVSPKSSPRGLPRGDGPPCGPPRFLPFLPSPWGRLRASWGDGPPPSHQLAQRHCRDQKRGADTHEPTPTVFDQPRSVASLLGPPTYVKLTRFLPLANVCKLDGSD